MMQMDIRRLLILHISSGIFLPQPAASLLKPPRCSKTLVSPPPLSSINEEQLPIPSKATMLNDNGWDPEEWCREENEARHNTKAKERLRLKEMAADYARAKKEGSESKRKRQAALLKACQTNMALPDEEDKAERQKAKEEERFEAEAEREENRRAAAQAMELERYQAIARGDEHLARNKEIRRNARLMKQAEEASKGPKRKRRRAPKAP